MKYTEYQYSPGAECNKAIVRFSKFEPECGAPEYHVMVGAPGCGPFGVQFRIIAEALNNFIEAYTDNNATAVFARLFLSDPANQPVDRTLLPECPISIVGQAPLGEENCRVILWAWLREGAVTYMVPSGMGIAELGNGLVELRVADITRPEMNSHDATCQILSDWNKVLASRDLSVADNCIRTWFFVRDIDNNYQGVVHGRNEEFERFGLTPATHFIASTGIGGYAADPKACVIFDAYAINGKGACAVEYLRATSHLNPTHEYGVAFERGTMVTMNDRVMALISGTASIDNRGRILYEGNIEGQTHRMMENIGVLLAEGGFETSDITMAIIYLRDIADADIVKHMIDRTYPGVPFVIVRGEVCRPGWLVEMECIAVRNRVN